jgi:hypothetical protein
VLSLNILFSTLSSNIICVRSEAQLFFHASLTLLF